MRLASRTFTPRHYSFLSSSCSNWLYRSLSVSSSFVHSGCRQSSWVKELHGGFAGDGSHVSARSDRLFATLEERGLAFSIAGPRSGLDRLFATKSVGAYCGVDPTAKSMHIGNLLPLMVLFWLYLYGHRAFTLVGGATSKIGDPSWRETAREYKAESERELHTFSIRQQMIDLWGRVEEFAGKSPGADRWQPGRREQLDNADWLHGLTFLEIMGTLGKGLKVSDLLAKDSMKTRLWAGKDKGNGGGLSLSELNYTALQSWDFWHLYREKDVQLQIGGGDQYGNITTSVDAVQHMIRSHVDVAAEANDLQRSYGLTTPLLTIGSGHNAKKMGKSCGNAVWLSPELTSDFELYQYFMRLPDDDVEKFWKMFTFRPINQIEKAIAEHRLAPERRTAHRALAYDFVSLHRGDKAADLAQQQHATLFKSKPSTESRVSSSESTVAASKEPSQTESNPSAPSSKANHIPSKGLAQTQEASDIPSTPYPSSLAFGCSVMEILVDLGVCQSRSEVQRMLSPQGGLYYGPQFTPIADRNLQFKPCNQAPGSNYSESSVPLAKGDLLILRRGKWKIKVLRVIPDSDYDAIGDEQWSPAWRAQRELLLS